MTRFLLVLAEVLLLVLVTSSSANLTSARSPMQQPNQTSFTLSFEGTLNIVYGDSKRGDIGETRYTLALANGSSVPLQYIGQQTLASYFLKRVLVSGRLGPSQNAVTKGKTSWSILADSVTLADQQLQPDQNSANQVTATAVTGTKKVLMLLLRFSDDSSVPHPPSFYSDLINPSTPPSYLPATVNGFYINASWNQFHWVADVGGAGGVPATDWLTLTYGKSHYAPCDWSTSCADLNAITNDAITAGVAAGINFPAYDNVNFVISNDLDCCAWGGSFTATINGVMKNYGATWEPPWGQEAGTYSHEMGHSLGLPHSGWVYYAYDSPWDVMSAVMTATSWSCGSYYSANDAATDSLYCGNPGDTISAPYKDYLGWIDPSHEAVTSTSASVTVLLDGDALPLGTAKKMIKVCITGSPCTGPNAHYFTVEARVRSAYGDGGIPGEGVIIHMFEADRPIIGGNCFFNSQSGWAWPIDSTPGDFDSVNCNSGGRPYPDYALFNAQWNPGQSYLNSTYGLTIKIQSRSDSTFTVIINGGSVPFSSLSSVLLNAASNTVYFIFPDGNTAHAKPAGVGYASVTDWTALGFAYGSLTNMPQIIALDTNSAYIDQSTGAPKVSNKIIVLFGGPLVNEAVHYYEANGIAPLHWGLVGGWTSGTEYYYNRNNQAVASIPLSVLGPESQDMGLIEAFKDQNGNTVIIFSGFGWQGTFVGGVYCKTVLISQLPTMPDSWYIYSWTDSNGNGFAEVSEVSSTPVNHGN